MDDKKTMGNRDGIFIMETPQHVRLSKLVRSGDKSVGSSAISAADKIADAGGSPRAQIDAARNSTRIRLSYKAHVGARQAERGRRVLAKKYLPCKKCGEIDKCSHTMDERRAFWDIAEINDSMRVPD